MKINCTKVYKKVSFAGFLAILLIALFVTTTVTNAQTITTIVGSTSGFSGDGGAATGALINHPFGIVFDAAGNYYFADNQNNRIRKVATDGTITTIAGSGITAGFSGDGGPATASVLNSPKGVALDATGNVYFADEQNHRVRKIGTDGIITTIGGTGSTTSNADGVATTVNLSSPCAVAVDAIGSVYVSDAGHNKVRKITTAGDMVTVAGNGGTAYANNVAATSTGLSNPQGITIDNSGNLYIADFGHNRIRKVNVAGTITLIAGDGTSGYVADGVFAVNTHITAPTGITVDSAKNVYFGGTGRLRRVDTFGRIATIAGSESTGFAGDGGAPSAAQLNGIYGLANKNGYLYITDNNNNRIRAIAPCMTPSIVVTDVTNIVPEVAIAGSSLTISGFAFNSDPTKDIVFFGGVKAAVTAASETQLNVTVPAGASFNYINVNNMACRLTGLSDRPFLPTFLNTAFSSAIHYNSALNFTSTSAPVQLIVADIDGDGKPDLLTCDNTIPKLSIYRNQTTGGSMTAASFASKIDYAGGGGGMTVADLDGDGKPEVISSNSTLATISVYRNTSTPGSINSGTLADTINFGVGSTPSDITSCDIDGDGKLDLIVCNRGSSTVSVLRNISTSDYIAFAPTINYFALDGANTVVAGDVDGDGKPDLIVSSATVSGGISILRNTATSGITSSSFATAINLAGFYNGVRLVDVDNDGKPDIVSTSGSMRVFRNQCSVGTINFGTTSSYVSFSLSGSPSPTRLNVGDVNGDGNPDIIVADNTGGRVAVFQNAGITGTINTSSFLSPVYYSVGTTPSGVGVADLNNDGLPDIAVANNGSGTISVLQEMPYLANVITGDTSICIGTTSTLIDATTGGTWSTSNAAIATVNASTGVVTGVSVGSAVISYVALGGVDTQVVTVVSGTLPSAGTITGSSFVCAGGTITLSNAVTGGVWSSTDTSVATVSNGVVGGLMAGNTIISYTVSNVCGIAVDTQAVDVLQLPVASTITGLSTVCAGVQISLNDSSAGGIWSSSNSLIATVDGTSGIVTGVATGGATISYTVSNACGSDTATLDINVTGAPFPGAIAGPTTVCAGSTIVLTNDSTGGVWSSSDNTIATIDAGTGTVTGVASGSVALSYVFSNSCGADTATQLIAVQSAPAAITGINTVGAGLSTTLSDITAGGTWSSSDPTVATVSATGVVSGLAYGNVTISYSTGCGTPATFSMTVANLLAGTGPDADTVCDGTQASFHFTPDGPPSFYTDYYWEVSTDGGTVFTPLTDNATYSGTGTNDLVVNAVAGMNGYLYHIYADGAVTINGLLTVKPIPDAGVISGSASVCAGSAITLSETATGGAWAASNTSATVVGGIVTGVAAGVDTIMYTVTSLGCTSSSSYVVTINALPDAGSLSGMDMVCVNSSVMLSSTMAGGTWTTSDASVATVDAGGNVTGAGAGSATIIYTSTNSCGTDTANHIITVNPLPDAGSISGAGGVCVGSTINLATTGTGGDWSSSSANATVDASGVVTGVGVGSAIITYSVTNSCGTAIDTQMVSVNVVPGGVVISSTSATTLCGNAPGNVSFSGPAGAVVRYQEMLTDEVGATQIDTLTTTLDGSGNSSVAITTTRPGLTGNITFVYTLIDATSGVCSATYTAADNVTFATHYINGWLTNVSGAGVYTVPTDGAQHTFMCTGNTSIIHLATEPFATAIFRIHNAAAGTDTYDTVVADGTGHYNEPTLPIFDTLVYTVVGISNAGCSAFEMTYNIDHLSLLPLPQAQITSRLIQNSLGVGVPIDVVTSQVCDGTDKNIDLKFNVEELGVVDGVPSTPMLTYHINGGADVTVPIEFYPTTTTINTGTISGNTTIYFTQIADNAGCTTTLTDSINLISIPAPVVYIAGATALCVGTAITLTTDSTGGTWTSSDVSVATIDASSGVVNGVSAGSTIISYSYTGLCGSASDTMTITVNAAPNAGAVSGPAIMCLGSTATLSSDMPGGVFSSFNTSVVSSDASGNLTAISVDTVTILYAISSPSCGSAVASHLITVTPLPDAGTLTGADSVCISSLALIASSAPGGTWTTSDASVATVDAGGNVTGVGAGSATIIYSSTNSCGTDTANHTITVNPLPDAGSISGADSICFGDVTTLTNTASGGTWSSADANVTVDAMTGEVTGMLSGTATITYTSSTFSCGTVSATHTLVVKSLPDAGIITGSDSVCAGAMIALSNTASGGIWSSSNNAIATVDATGSVSGVTAGAATITYTSYVFGCSNARTVFGLTVNAAPDAGSISGADSICFGTSTTLTNTASGGTWSSADANVAVDAMTGEVTGMLSGAATITYTSSTFSCGSVSSTHIVVVKSLPDAGTIAGSDSVCAGAIIALSNTTSGGVWSSSNNAIATVDATGSVSGVTAGAATITYTSYVFGCSNARTIFGLTVNAAPDAGSISGADSICFGTSTTLTNTASGGTWSSADANVAVDAMTGEVTGMLSGTATITYTSSTFSCGTVSSTHTLVVKSLPDAGTIAGSDSVCAGGSIVLTNTASGGVWSSSNNAIATVDATGSVSGVTVGTTTISYTSSIFGCTSATSTYDVTVNAAPDAGSISGADSICFGTSTTLTNTASGGTWSSADANVAVDAMTGEVTGMLSGTATITYTSSTFSCGSVSSTHTLVVKSLPDAGTIAGSDSVCAGGSIVLTNTASGGVWSSSNNAIATVDATGSVSSVTVGTTTISYTSSIFGCTSATSTYDVTVNAAPDAGSISGAGNVCFGLTTTLTNTVSGGTWSSSDDAIATVDAAGIVTGVATGIATISYTANTFSCGSISATHTITVDSLPDPGSITGFDTVAIGTDITLTASMPGGVWTSSDPAATVVGGVVTGVSLGNATITYAVTNGCGTTFTTKALVINGCPLPDTGIISSSASSICAGINITLTTTVAGGDWSTSDGAVATVDMVTGMVAGVAAGNVIISYTTTNTCGSSIDTMMLTIDALPNAGTISGADSVCAGSSVTLASTATSGTWSSAGANVTVNAVTGEVAGITTGTATITYTASTFSCGSATATYSVTVNALPNAGTISGADSVCAGSSITLASTATGGAWSSADANVTVNALTGEVAGITAGTATITYTASTFSCGSATATYSVTVNALPNAGTISGLDSVCAGSSITLASTATGGAWSSADANVTVNAVTGEVAGITAGTATITYTASTFSCGSATATYSVTVNALPNAGTISGLDSVCAGSSVTLASSATGGTWSSADANVTVNAVTGEVAGITAGTATITYTASTFSCGSATATYSVTVNALPNAGTISGLDSVCAGSSVTLASTATGGAWTSADANVTVNATTGEVAGITAGTATITYTASTFSCGSATATYSVTVNALPNAGIISGLDSVCAGSSITLASTATGGTWSSADANVSVNAVTGEVAGITTGTATITYTASTFSCGSATATYSVTVNALPNAGTISGLDSVCAGSSVTLASTATGGTWSSADANVTVNAVTGEVAGIAAGTATITYTASTFSCGSATATYSVTVNALPNAGTISGLDSVCAGSSITLASTATGGAWSSADANVTVNATTGEVAGITAGTATITYTASTFSCGSATATYSVTVNVLPNAGTISGLDSVCAGSSVTLASTATGGAWSSTDANVTVNAVTGEVAGIAAGTATITYTASTFSCGSATAIYSVTVNALPNAGTISGLDSVCAGSSITLASTATGGAWSSADANVTVNATTGEVAGITAGTATITYTASTFSCGSATATYSVTVNALPNAGTISGSDSVCAGSSITLTNVVSGGSWTSSDNLTATVDAAGMVNGIAAGTVTIVYTAHTFSCGDATATHVVTVNALPVVPAITGVTSICEGATATLSNTTTGGVWSSSNPGIATIDATGVVSSVVAGTTDISYTVTNMSGCTTVQFTTFTINPLPVLSPVTGAIAVAALSSITLTDTASGGIWTSSDVTRAVINGTTGVVTGVAIGTATITYTKTSGFGCTSFVTYNLIVAGSLTSTTILPVGSATLCHGNSVNLVTVTAGGATDLSYQWYIDGVAITGATNQSYITDTFGYFTLVISNLAGSHTLTGVTVVLPPTPVIHLTGANTLYTGSFATYQWYLDGVAITGANTSIYNETAPGAYTVVVSDGNGCTDTASAYYIWPAGVQNVGGAGINIRLFPNPATSTINIQSSIKVNVAVLTADGKKVLESNDATSIDISTLANGMYMMMVYDTDNMLLKVERIMKVD